MVLLFSILWHKTIRGKVLLYVCKKENEYEKEILD